MPAQPNLSLLTDLYQLTMAAGYWRLGRAEDEAVFHLFFRRAPFAGGYAVAAGLEAVVDYLRGFRFGREELDFLRGLPGPDGKPLFEAPFLEALGALELSVDIDAVPEGTVVFPHEPILRVRGGLLEAQLLETALLNLLNFPTLIATKAARICQAARQASRGEPGAGAVLEFGLRRAQGIDGALSASRAAYLGGCAATSNVLAGMRFGIPVRGTHAHSWVMSFDEEQEAFEAYARAMPGNCVFLVDTYDTLEGVRRAIEVGRQLRERGHELLGVRLDSGDLAYLSQEARRLLDAAGFPEARIVASNDLDEHTIESLGQQGARIAVWGVGTKLATAYDQPALGGVYKLAALRTAGGEWEPRLKLSEDRIKVSIPGVLQVRRYEGPDGFVADAIYDEELGIGPTPEIIDPAESLRRREIPPDLEAEDLLVPLLRGGELVYELPPLGVSRERAAAQVARLHAGVRRFDRPHRYPAGLERALHERREALIDAARGRSR